MIHVTSSGSFNNLERFLRAAKRPIDSVLHKAGKRGVSALAAATPKNSGRVASSWSYAIIKDSGGYTLAWKNSDVENGFPVAIMLQYGHGTGTGGYVAGIDYINPAIRPVFDAIADEVWRVVSAS